MTSRRLRITLLFFLIGAILLGFWLDRASLQSKEEMLHRTLGTYVERFAGRVDLSEEEINYLEQDSLSRGYFLYLRSGADVLFSNASELVRETPSPGAGVSVYRSAHLSSRVIVARSELGNGSMRLYYPLRLQWPLLLWVASVSTLLFFLLIRDYVEHRAVQSDWLSAARRIREEDPQQEWGQAPAYMLPLFSAVDKRLQQADKKTRDLMLDHSQMEAIVYSVGSGVIALDEDHNVFQINPAAAQMLGVTREEAIGKDALLLLRDNDIDDALASYDAGGDLPQEPFTLQMEGRDLSVLLSKILYSTFETGITMTIEDTTELNRLLKMRRDFVANVSHELRTPLTSIKGFTQTLIELNVDPEESKRFLRIIDSEVEKLELLVSDLEVLATIEKNEQLREDDVPFYPSEIIEDEREALMALLERTPLELEMDIPKSNSFAYGNPNLYRQLVYNLTENAVKYSKPEGGTIRIELREEGETGYLHVSDEGIGIPPHEIPRIFERFYRVDRSRGAAAAGTGLGLAIVKHIAISMGGEVSAQSTPGQGSVFTFVYPLTELTRT